MEQKEILEALKLIRNHSPKRKFDQSVDLIINLKDIDIKKDKVESYVVLPNPPKKKTITVFISSSAKEVVQPLFDYTLTKDEFAKYSSKKQIKELVNSVDFFVAQADLMGQIAVSFGKVLGPKGKMPNPKAGCVIPVNPPKQLLIPLVERLHKTAKLETKGGTMVKLIVGKESMKDEDIAANVLAVYDNLLHAVPQGKNNIKNVAVKLTMGPVIKLGEKEELVKKRLESRIKPKEKKAKPKEEKKPKEKGK